MPILGSFGALAARAWKTASGAFSAFSDNFNRTTSGSLGTSSSGGLWAALRGIWFADGAAAKSNDAASTYPISQIEMTKADVTESISVGSNVLISANGTVQSVAAGNVAGFYTAQLINLTSTTGLSVGQWISATNGTGSLYGGAPDFVEITSIDSSTSLSYRIKGGTTPVAGSVTNVIVRTNDGGSGVALWITDSGNWWGVSYGRSIDTACNCATCLNSFCSGGFAWTTNCTGGTYTAWAPSCSGGTYTAWASICTGGTYTAWAPLCTGGTFTGYSLNSYCPAGYANYASYSCIGWSSSTSAFCASFSFAKICAVYTSAFLCKTWVLDYSCNSGYFTTTTYNCTTYSASWAFACNSTLYYGYTSSQYCGGYTNYSSSFCGGWTDYASSYCAGYTNYSSSYCGGWTNVNYCAGLTYGYVTCNCQTCYPPYIRVIQSASNVVSEITRWTLSSMAAAFRVITNSSTKVITIRPYKETSMTTQIGTDLTYNASTATMANKFGIVLSPSDQIQGNQLDDFNITSN